MVVKVRTVLCQRGTYLMRAAPQRPLGAEPVEAEPRTKPSNTRVRMGERYPPGTIVMTTAGPAEVLHKYQDGSSDYALTWEPETEGLRTTYSLPSKQFWLLNDHPDWEFDDDGQRVEPPKKEGPIADTSQVKKKGCIHNNENHTL